MARDRRLFEGCLTLQLLLNKQLLLNNGNQPGVHSDTRYQLDRRDAHGSDRGRTIFIWIVVVNLALLFGIERRSERVGLQNRR